MIPLRNDVKSTSILYTGSHKNFPIHYGLWGKFLKHILTYLHCTKYNEINTRLFKYTKVCAIYSITQNISDVS